ncbi:hypothetical protein JW916_08145 [Candidatus Sumerlaeota bacterium]|nr:hypothetical protein [Candidatus Sumerlaeota bacterium]
MKASFRRLLLAVLWIAPIAILLWRYAYERFCFPSAGFDDANIFMVYARNLAHGDGLVWHVGGERVEGFSSFLYVLVLAPLFLLTDKPEWAIATINILLTVGALAAVATAYGRRVGLETPETCAAPTQGGDHREVCVSVGTSVFLPVAWTLSAPAFIAWTTVSQMDTALWFAFLAFLVLSVCRSAQSSSPGRHAPLAIAAVLSPLVRPEAMLLVPVVVLSSAAAVWAMHRSARAGLKHALAGLVPFGASLALLTAFRQVYFGYPLPNTYYAKVSRDYAYNVAEGLKYFDSFLRSNILIPLAFAAAVYALGRPWFSGETSESRRHRGHFVFVASVVALTGHLAPILDGGDHFAWHRFFQPFWPFLGIALIDAGFRAAERLGARDGGGLMPGAWRASCCSATLLFVLLAQPGWLRMFNDESENPAHEGRIALRGREVGTRLAGFFAASGYPSVGVLTAGGIAMTYPGPVIDLMGLNDTRMGHSPGNRHGIKNHAAFSLKVFYELTPELLLPMPTEDNDTASFHTGKWARIPFKGLLDKPRFKEIYTFVTLSPVDEPDRGLVLYVRNDVLDKMRDSKSLNIVVHERKEPES